MTLDVLLGLFQWIKYGRSDSMRLLRLGHKRQLNRYLAHCNTNTVLSLQRSRLTTQKSPCFKEARVSPHEETMWRDPGTSLKERNASQVLTAPVHHCSSSSHCLTVTVLEISHQDCRAESFLNSWLTETRKDNKMIVVLSQIFLGGMIYFEQ